jgi:NAD-dependent dihydropyrimidine dehydrogenase PreA subunit
MAQIKDNCINCTICEPVCPTGAITAGTTRFVIDTDTCTECQVCVPICPVAAIQPAKK